MAKWIYQPPRDPLKYHPFQHAFWDAHSARHCQDCNASFHAPQTCPKCGGVGARDWHRLLLLSGRRGGKTVAGAIAGAKEACVPGTIGWCCAPTNPKLHRYVIPAFQALIPPDLVASWNSEFLDLRLKNGSLIHFQTLEDPDQGRGQGLHWLWIDEICELSEETWFVLRPSLTEHRGVAFFTSSPRGFDWVYKNFYARASEGFPGYWATKYLTKSNPIITQAELDEAKATMSPEMYRQEFEADFVDFKGAIYANTIVAPQVIRTQDEIKRFIPEWPFINPERQILIGIDTGADHPFAAVKLVITEQGIVVCGEYLQRGSSFIEHARGLHKLANSNNVRWALNKNDKQPSIELAQHGIFAMLANNEVRAGVERVKTWLHNHQLWFFEPLVPETIRQIGTYRWDENKRNDGASLKEQPYKVDDDLPDALRYALMSWPHLPKRQVIIDPDEDIKRDLELGRLSQEGYNFRQRMRKIERTIQDREKEPGWDQSEFWL